MTVTEKEWFECVESGNLVEVGELLAEDESLIELKKSSPSPYEAAIAMFAAPLMGENTVGHNALSYAIMTCADSEMVEFLIEETPEDCVDATWGDGNTALHAASFHGESEYITALLQAGADPQATNKLGYSPIDVSCDDETKQLFASMGHVSKRVIAPEIEEEAAKKAGADRRQSLATYKDRKSMGHQEQKIMSMKPTELKTTVSSAISEEAEEEGEGEGKGDAGDNFIAEIMKTSTVFGRKSFGVKEYMQIATSTPEEKKKIKEKRQQLEEKNENLRRQLDFQTSPTTTHPNNPDKVVVKVEQSPRPENYDPMRSPESRSGTVKTLTPEMKKSPIKITPGSVSASRSRIPRDSIGTFIENINYDNEVPSLPKAASTPKLFVKVLDITELQVEGLKSDAKLYCLLQSEKHTRSTSTFKEAKNISLNEEFVLGVEEGTQVTVELRRKRSKGALKMMSVFSGSNHHHQSGGDPFQPDYSNDVLLAKFTVSVSHLEKNCRNKLKKSVFVWQPAQSGARITGVISLQMYWHVDQLRWTPRDLAECSELHKQRVYETTTKIWGEGFIHIGKNFLHWTRRYGRLQGGRLFTFEQETKEPQEVIDLTGFEFITIMDGEECSVPHNFKINTTRGHYYFYAESKRDQAVWIKSIIEMMGVMQAAERADGDQSLSRSSSVKSVASSIRSTRTAATPIRG